jgi:hypothetical protein
MRKGIIYVRYKDARGKHVAVTTFRFSGFWSFLKSLVVTYRTRCDRVSINFEKINDHAIESDTPENRGTHKN